VLSTPIPPASDRSASPDAFPRLILLIAIFLFATYAIAQVKGSAARPASTSADLDLATRQQQLETAKQSGDTDSIAPASRRVISLGLRQLAALALSSTTRRNAAELFRRSLDFEDTPDAHLDLAAAYLLSNRADEALSIANGVLLKDPQNARAWYLQGQVWSAKKNYSQAIDSFSHSLAVRPDPSVKRVLNQVRLNAKQGNRPTPTITARDLVSVPHATAASIRGIVASALNDLATTEARQEQFSLALAHFHEAEQWDPELPGLMRNIGLSAARVQDDKETIRALRLVVAQSPQDRVARTLLGTALFSRGEYTEAVRIFTPLGDSALENFEVAFAWASSLAKTNRYVESSALLDQLEAHQLSPDNLLLVAQTWAQMGNYSRTVATCHRALQTDPKLPRAHSIAGLALVREDRPADAEQEFRAELQLSPEDSGSEYQLAFVLLQQAKAEEAVQHLRAVLKRQPGHPEANYELGKQLLADGEPAEAIPYLEAASRLKPQLEPVHYQLQAAYRAVGRREDADREAKIYREMKAKSRNITLPPPVQKTEAVQPQ